MNTAVTGGLPLPTHHHQSHVHQSSQRAANQPPPTIYHDLTGTPQSSCAAVTAATNGGGRQQQAAGVRSHSHTDASTTPSESASPNQQQHMHQQQVGGLTNGHTPTTPTGMAQAINALDCLSDPESVPPSAPAVRPLRALHRHVALPSSPARPHGRGRLVRTRPEDRVHKTGDAVDDWSLVEEAWHLPEGRHEHHARLAVPALDSSVSIRGSKETTGQDTGLTILQVNNWTQYAWENMTDGRSPDAVRLDTVSMCRLR
ncbi:unnamed protein product [Sphagnum balticum]